MPFDNSWRSLLNPGHTTAFFQYDGIRPFDANAQGFNAVNAWWLCELSRLIYRKEAPEIDRPQNEPTRNQILESVALREIRFFLTPRVQAALYVSTRQNEEDFAVLVFRGTRTRIDSWYCNLQMLQSKWPCGGKVHLGFKKLFGEIWKEIEPSLSSIQVPLFFTGHSSGAALAALAATVKPPKALYTFGSPRVGDARFADLFHHIPAFRVSTPKDIVTNLPPKGLPLKYVHVGENWTCTQYRHVMDTHNRIHRTDVRPNIGFHEKPIPFLHRIFHSPPTFLSDHAPANYTNGIIGTP